MSSNKRTKLSSEATDRETAVRTESGDTRNEIVGLEMADGKVFYCCRSSIFSAQFLSRDPVKQDGDGRSIYFVGANSERFQSHILPCLLSNKVPLSKDPEFLRVLREEAAHYGLNDIVSSLDATDAAVEPGSSGGKNGENDELVGLKMADGKIFYCRRSTLAKASQQFFSKEPVKRDSDGISIYFVGGDSDLFQIYLLPYLRSNKAPSPKDPELLRELREEAAHYGLNDLVASLDEKFASKDDIIGLEFTDGIIRYCHRSTLTNATGSYFAGRFGGSFADGVSFHNVQGQPVYFIERSGELFENYILPYLSKHSPGQMPPFRQDPVLWRQLREEAEFYALDGLFALLYVTHSCKPNDNIHGILFWLGSAKGTAQVYRNPNKTGAVHVGGWVDKLTMQQRRALGNANVSLPLLARSIESRNALVQYRSSVYGVSGTIPNGRNAFCSAISCHNLCCGQSFRQVPTVLDLKSVSVRLTHYSLRYDRCGMTHWNLEGSEDGDKWDVLHEARNDPHLRMPQAESINQRTRVAKADIEKGVSTKEQAEEALVSYAECELRHTWTIDPSPTAFYRYFRLIGIGEEHNGSRCLHGVGLELFGDVHES